VARLIRRETGLDEIAAISQACKRNPDLMRLVDLEEQGRERAEAERIDAT
jgi:hypothetical protein